MTAKPDGKSFGERMLDDAMAAVFGPPKPAPMSKLVAAFHELDGARTAYKSGGSDVSRSDLADKVVARHSQIAITIPRSRTDALIVLNSARAFAQVLIAADDEDDMDREAIATMLRAALDGLGVYLEKAETP